MTILQFRITYIRRLYDLNGEIYTNLIELLFFRNLLIIQFLEFSRSWIPILKQ